MKLTISAIKADVGSIGGHTKPTDDMLSAVRKEVQKAIKNKLIIDGMVTHTGDDIAITMTHKHGTDSPKIHKFAWDCFIIATGFADECGCYGAGQDLLVDAPSSNIRGAGPGVAEIEFDFKEHKYRPAETFMVFTADKCGPGAYNLPFFLAFADPMYCAGLMLPKMIKGFTFNIIDMNDTKGGELSITLNAPEDYYKICMLLRDGERFGIRAIYAREEKEQVASLSADRLHSIAGKYTGKDDPIALVRTQGIFPAPEEILSPFAKTHLVGGDARGSHNMPLMPVPINTAVTGLYCLPIVACLGFSITAQGRFSDNVIDFFDNPAWDYIRLQAQERALAIRSQGWSGAAMLPYSELEYSGFKKTLTDLLRQFKLKK